MVCTGNVQPAGPAGDADAQVAVQGLADPLGHPSRHGHAHHAVFLDVFGVDAPAVMPRLANPSNDISPNESAVCMKKVFSHCCLHIS